MMNVGTGKIVDRIFLVEDHPQILGKMGTGSAGEREPQNQIESVSNAGEKLGGE